MTIRLSISLLGTFQVSLDGRPAVGLATDKARALLAYLAVEANRPHSRSALAGLLWPDQPEDRARQSLRQALLYLRQALGEQDDREGWLEVSRETVQLNRTGALWLDVAAFVALNETCRQHRHRHAETCQPCLRRWEEMATLYRGEFLAGFLVDDSDLFEEWTWLKREWLHRQAIEVLATLAACAERRGDYAQAREYAWQQVELEPWREEAHRALMRLLAQDGQRSAALAQYQACRRALAAELDVEPTTETQALYEQIKSANGPTGQSALRGWAQLDSAP